jgi:hypothetical protein
MFYIHGVSSLMGKSFTCFSVRSLVARIPTHQTAYTDACKTYHNENITIFLKMNPQGLKLAEDHKNKY